LLLSIIQKSFFEQFSDKKERFAKYQSLIDNNDHIFYVVYQSNEIIEEISSDDKLSDSFIKYLEYHINHFEFSEFIIKYMTKYVSSQ